MKYLQVTDVSAYRIADALSDEVWNIVLEWDSFAKWTLGKQFVNAVDSISVNIAEGFGRYHKKDKINFYRYARGSAKESVNWIEKAKRRELLTDKQYSHILAGLNKLPREINYLVQQTNIKLAY